MTLRINSSKNIKTIFQWNNDFVLETNQLKINENIIEDDIQNYKNKKIKEKKNKE